MRIAHRIGIAAMTAALAAGSGLGRAGVPPDKPAEPPVDTGLLEFLGSVDPSTDSASADDGSWLTYLSQVNLGSGSKPPQTQQAPAPPKPARPASGAAKPNGQSGMK